MALRGKLPAIIVWIGPPKVPRIIQDRTVTPLRFTTVPGFHIGTILLCLLFHLRMEVLIVVRHVTYLTRFTASAMFLLLQRQRRPTL